MNDPATCEHFKFVTSARIGRLTNEEGVVTRYSADITIICADCGIPFRFLGLPPGVDLNGATVSVDGEEARLAIGPANAVASFLDGDCPVGFTVRRGDINER